MYLIFEDIQQEQHTSMVYPKTRPTVTSVKKQSVSGRKDTHSNGVKLSFIKEGGQNPETKEFKVTSEGELTRLPDVTWQKGENVIVFLEVTEFYRSERCL